MLKIINVLNVVDVVSVLMNEIVKLLPLAMSLLYLTQLRNNCIKE